MVTPTKTRGNAHMIWFILFLITVPAANWMIGNIGTFCIPDGPCLIPVGFGLDAPSGVLMVGAALVLRDLVHSQLGAKWSLVAIGCGSALSYLVAPPSIVFASVAAFTIAELLDFAVYSKLKERGMILAMAASSAVGSVIDSGIFLWLAFGSIDHIGGQIVGKTWMVLLAVSIIWIVKKYKKGM
jgi:queuosine precursor transporter